MWLTSNYILITLDFAWGMNNIRKDSSPKQDGEEIGEICLLCYLSLCFLGVWNDNILLLQKSYYSITYWLRHSQYKEGRLRCVHYYKPSLKVYSDAFICIRPTLKKILFPVDRVGKKIPSREGGIYLFFFLVEGVYKMY